MDVAGLFAACLAAMVVYRLAGHRLVAADARWRHLMVVPSGRRAKHVAFAVALCVHAAVLLSSFSTSRDFAMHLQETEAKLTRMEQIIQPEKHHNEMIHSLASMLSKNSDDIKLMIYKVTKADVTPNSESSITVEDSIQPPKGETMDQEFPKRSDGQEDAPAPCPPDEATERHKPWRWRTFPVPEGHVFVVECVGDELAVHIRPASHGGSKHNATGTGDNDQQLPFTCGHPPEAGTPSFYEGGSFGALFWSPPGPDEGQERVLPIPWPRLEMWERLAAAVLESTWAVDTPMVEEITTPPESMTLSPDVVMCYRRLELDGRTEVRIAATEDVEHLLCGTEEQDGPAVTALAPYSVLPTYSWTKTAPGIKSTFKT